MYTVVAAVYTSRMTPHSDSSILAPFQECLFSCTENISNHWWVAFSGGVDSTLLLYLLSDYARQFEHVELKAIHVHHGLQSRANDWANHCQTICDSLSVPLVIERVTVSDDTQLGLEQRARNARWQVFDHLLGDGDALWLGHHADDQSETLLLNLLRGCGVTGAQAIKVKSQRNHYQLLRPLLSFSKLQLIEAATSMSLTWVDDPSNESIEFRRNFLRHEIFPRLESQWPGYRTSLNRFTSHMQQTHELLSEYAASDLERVSDGPSIHLPKLNRLSEARRANCLRFWILMQTHYTPGASQLNQLIAQLSSASPESKVSLTWGNWSIQQAGEHLVILPSVQLEAISFSHQWTDWPEPLNIPELSLRLTVNKTSKGGLRPPTEFEKVTVRCRNGGERCHPGFRRHSTSLKKVYQELGIPSWQRNRIPLVFYNEKLVAAVGVFIEQQFVEQTGETQWLIAMEHFEN